MKRIFLFPLFSLFTVLGLQAQVTRINSNKSLQFNSPLSNTKSIFVSKIDETLWVSDGTLAGTFQLSADIKYVNTIGNIAFLDGKLIFTGNLPATGNEVYITDGTIAGTILLKDINPGVADSSPDYVANLTGFLYFTAFTPGEGGELWRTDGTPGGTTFVKDINPGVAGSSIDEVEFLNNVLYFTAETAAEGRELWKSDGTPGGTAMVKDIVPGAAGSNYPGKYNLFSSGTYLLFMAATPSSGVELWRSDGTNAGTILLMDINAGADSSNGRSFYSLNNIVLFAAKDATHGDEIWRTDGTPGGTTLLADINLAGSSTSFELIPGVGTPVFLGFHTFNNRAYFNAYNGTSTGTVWGTDGTVANTSLLKDIVTGVASIVAVTNAINLPNKFIFPVTDVVTRSEFWESNGTPAGTILFKAFTPSGPGIIPSFLFNFYALFSGGTQPLFQGNKFFFTMGTAAEGNELWISDGVDGTDTHTHIVKDINPGVPGSNPINGFYIFTSNALYFAANNGINGRELWKTDGTVGGTTIVADLVAGTVGSNPQVVFFLVNGKILFQANDGDDAVLTDLYAVDGAFTPLPVSLTEFTVAPKSDDALLNWRTSQEINSKDFTIQRSFNGLDFENIGTVAASGTSAAVHAYSFIDAGIMNCGKEMVYYRLLSADIDGKSAHSQVISLKLKNTGSWNVRLLNNPVSENLKVILSGITQKVQLSIVDMNGKKISTSTLSAVNGQISLSAASLPHGRYMLFAETRNERKIIQFVK